MTSAGFSFPSPNSANVTGNNLQILPISHTRRIYLHKRLPNREHTLHPGWVNFSEPVFGPETSEFACILPSFLSVTLEF